MTILNNDYKDLLHEFNAAGVEYVIVGAHAMAAHGYRRFTVDFDVLVNPTPVNAARVHAALRRFGAPLQDVAVEDFAKLDLIYQIGVAPVRIDVITEVEGVSFDQVWAHRLEATYGDERMFIMSLDDLIVNKTAANRSKDIADVKALKKLR